MPCFCAASTLGDSIKTEELDFQVRIDFRPAPSNIHEVLTGPQYDIENPEVTFTAGNIRHVISQNIPTVIQFLDSGFEF
jgi:hypothetical protein